MRNFFLWITLCFSTSLFAQEDIALVQKVNFYGVDFSHANLYNLKENPETIRQELARINDLFMSQSKKYDIKKYLKKDILNYCLEATDANNREMPVEKLMTDNNKAELSSNQIQEIINGLSCEYEGTGLVFIAENLDKGESKAFYVVVFFDGKTKEIIYQQRVSGKAQGFGIRNFWAKSVYTLMKKWKY